jgi:CubicO group peptidase (beta-lactamase class C family)
VTIRQLLEMQSGIGDFFGPEFDATPKDRLRRNADFLPMFASKPLLFAPGTDRGIRTAATSSSVR